MSEHADRQEEQEPRVVVRDKRRIDPESGEIRVAAPATGPASEMGAAPVDAAHTALEERTADLQRLKAEFDNYRKRVERDRVAVAEQSTAAVLAQLLPVLDDIDRARAHGEVTGPFMVVADSLEGTLAKLGLSRIGDEGEPFDPTLHEAVMHSESPDVDGPTNVSVFRAGYQFRDRLLRPAMVAVAEPPAGTVAEPRAAVGEAEEPMVVAEDATPE
jgi:molecular chaperone GrpE